MVPKIMIEIEPFVLSSLVNHFHLPQTPRHQHRLSGTQKSNFSYLRADGRDEATRLVVRALRTMSCGVFVGHRGVFWFFL